MSVRGSLLSALLATLVGCTSANEARKSSDGGTPPGTGGNGSVDSGAPGTGGGGGSSGGGGGASSGGGGGSENGGGGGTASGGGGGSSGGGGTSSGGGGGTSGGGGGGTSSGGGGGTSSGGGGGTSSGGGGGSSGGGGGGSLSKCGGPLDTVAPTASSIVKDGALAVTSYSTGLPTSTLYKSLTVFYPTAGSGPFVVVMVSPGLTEILQYLQPWAQRFASYGYVAVFVEANNTNSDSEAMRADGMWAAIASIKGENTRTGSPLFGKLSQCIVTSGHSLGGGASISIANEHPLDVKAALGFNPYDPTTNFTSIVAPTLILAGQSDTTAPPAQHGLRQYNTMSTSISKEYVEIAGGNHQAALSPATIPGQYAISWIKFTVDGDTRYRPFLNEAASGISDFLTTLS